MRRRDVEASIAEAGRVERTALSTPGLEEAKRELLARIVAEPRGGPEPEPGATNLAGGRRAARLPRRRYLAFGAAVAAATVVLLGGGIGEGPAGSPTPALGAGLARLTEVSPHLLLGASGWQVEGATQTKDNRGVIRFFRGDGEPVAYLDGRLAITFVARARLEWRADAPPVRVHAPNPDFTRLAEVPALGATARVFARAIRGFGVRQYVAVWPQAGRYLKFRSFAPSLTAFEHRLVSLRQVSRAAWLRALPTHLVRHRELTLLEEPTEKLIVFHCGRPLSPALAARRGNPKVRYFEKQCDFAR